MNQFIFNLIIFLKYLVTSAYLLPCVTILIIHTLTQKRENIKYKRDLQSKALEQLTDNIKQFNCSSAKLLPNMLSLLFDLYNNTFEHI
ncbi:MAG TPA: hypothetical protein VIK86_02235 [Candidatus Paceibacterota bacterium]